MSQNFLTRIDLQDFTAFSSLGIDFTPGINLIIGNSGSGKSHLLKLLYCACRITITGESLFDRLLNSFMPSSQDIGRLVHWRKTSSDIAIYRGIDMMQASFFRSPPWVNSDSVSGKTSWYGQVMPSAFIPANDILANAPGFLSLWDRREVYFEAEIADLLKQAYLPELNKLTPGLIQILIRLEETIGGKVEIKGEEFFLVKNSLELEFSLISETVRQLGLLSVLIKNGTIGKNSIIFWDEPSILCDEGMKEILFEFLLETAKIPCQIFLSSHDARLMDYFSSYKKSNQFAVHHLLKNSRTGKIVSKSSFF